MVKQNWYREEKGTSIDPSNDTMKEISWDHINYYTMTIHNKPKMSF